MSEQALTKLLAKLHQRGVLHWEEELRLGKPIYDALLALVRSGSRSQQVEPGALTAHQTANALVVLHRLREHGSEPELFSVTKRAVSDDSLRVRDQAVILTIGMMRAKGWQDSYYNAETLDLLRGALSAGLSKDVHDLAADLIEKGPAAVDCTFKPSAT